MSYILEAAPVGVFDSLLRPYRSNFSEASASSNSAFSV
jgi:hypothetical protein